MSNEPIKSDKIPVLQGQLELVKQELKSEITTLRLETKAGFQAMEARFESLQTIILGMKAMMEEKKSQNLYVMDGYTFLFNKYEKSECRLEKVEQKVFGIEQEN